MNQCELIVVASAPVGRITVGCLQEIALGETLIGLNRLPITAELKVRGVRLCGAVVGRKGTQRAVRA